MTTVTVIVIGRKTYSSVASEARTCSNRKVCSRWRLSTMAVAGSRVWLVRPGKSVDRPYTGRLPKGLNQYASAVARLLCLGLLL